MALGNLRDLAVNDFDIGSGGNLGLDKLGKLDAVDRQGAAGGNGSTMGAIERSSSAFSKPAAESGRVDLNELEQTSSAK